MSLNVLNSYTFKVFGIGFLALLMLIPLAQVQGLINERSQLRRTAIDAIAQGWGGEQQLGGPVIAVPRLIHVQTSTGWITQETTEILLPDELNIDAVLAPDLRKYGIYETSVYTAEIKIDGKFLAQDISKLPDPDSYNWQKAELRLPVSDVHGIRRISALHFDEADATFGPSDGGVAGYAAVGVPIDARKFVGDTHRFQFDMTLAGTQSLQLLPLARRTQAHMSSSWPDPTFNGTFLPATRHVDAAGFDAKWQVLDLNHRFGQHWREDAEHRVDVAASAFGTVLYQPASIYQQNERAGKYGILFIALTFVAFFLFEVLKKLRVHPVQYLLVGLALATFYVVLLALSEHIGFAWAYLAAATSVVLMVSAYAGAILRMRMAGLTLGAMMALIYGLLYGLIASEQYSLLMGAIALLAIVAALMHLTRKVDWYAATSTVAPALASK
ncbi:MAG: cell envelope integrity protein CreD [Rudaea sp.]